MKKGRSLGISIVLLLAGACGQPPSNEKTAGKNLFEKNCSVCHGLMGDGKGEAAYLLQPKPRNFRAGKFRLVTSQNLVPSREDLFRTITKGMPGTPMPPWEQLPESNRRLLVDYVLKLDRDGWIDVGIKTGYPREKAEKYADTMIRPDEPFTIPPEPAVTPEGLKEGRRYYLLACAKCHGEEGEGKSDPAWRTSEGFPTWARNLREGVFKGGRDSKQLYMRFATGLPGTPMPSQSFTPEQTWRVVQYVLSLSDPEAQQRAEIRAQAIVAEHLESVPSSPGDSQWERAPVIRVPLMPLWWREGYIASVRVKAVHDGRRLGILLEWDDMTRDGGGVRQTRFPDAAAVQLTANTSPPLFAMGAAGEAVNIWYWKALWDEDRKEFQDVGTIFPRMAGDGYYSSEQGWSAGPLRDKLYRPAAKLGNFMASAERARNVQDANAGGLGTLTSQCPEKQNVEGFARRLDGGWRLELVRNIATSDEGDVTFRPGQPISIAFAVWDGSAGERDGQKSVSIWNTLTLK